MSIMRSDFREMVIEMTKLQVANAKALAIHHKFQESDWQEQQTKDIKEMDEDGIDHPFKEDDDYSDRGLHRSDFIDNEFI